MKPAPLAALAALALAFATPAFAQTANGFNGTLPLQTIPHQVNCAQIHLAENSVRLWAIQRLAIAGGSPEEIRTLSTGERVRELVDILNKHQLGLSAAQLHNLLVSAPSTLCRA